MVSIQIQLNPAHTLRSYFHKIQVNIIIPSLKWFLHLSFLNLNFVCAILISHMHSIRSTHPILLELMTKYLTKSVSHEAPHYVIFSTIMLPSPS
jgi:hypothetical protein